MKKSFTIGFCAGEVSGDLHGAYIFKRLKELFPDYNINGFGLGGPLMKNEGIEILKDLTHRSSVGIIESLPYVFDRYLIGKKLLKIIEEKKPDIFIFIDNQGFNIPLSFAVKKSSVKTIYYFPPPISIWGKWNGKKLQKSIDYFFIPFKDDFIEYQKYSKDKSIFFGHPFFDKYYLYSRLNKSLNLDDISEIKRIMQLKNIKFINNNIDVYNEDNTDIEKNYLENNFKELIKNNKLDYIYLLPGSRIQEIKTLLPLFLKVSKYLYEKYNIMSILPISNQKFKQLILNLTKPFKKHVFLLNENYYWIYKNALFSLMASGTATLEGLILNVPMIICYKISGLTFFLGKLFVNTRWVGMANIIGKKEVAKELLQKQMNFNNLIRESEKLVNNKNYYNNVKQQMNKVVSNLIKDYNDDAISLYAEKIINIIEEKQ